LLLLSAQSIEAHKVVWKFALMGWDFEITAVHTEKKLAIAAINSAVEEINRIEQLISSWDPNSETSKINQNAGIKNP